MDKTKLSEELLSHLSAKASNTAEGEAVRRLAESAAATHEVNPPPEVWAAIQRKIAAASVNPQEQGGFLTTLKSFFSTPLVPVFAVAIAGLMVGAVLLLNRATAPHEQQIVELAAQRPQKKGDVLLAQGMRIENSAAGAISRIAGTKEKIVFYSGEWKVTLRHSELERPTRFVFPGGALEPVGTAFTIRIQPAGTDVQLTEGKIRLLQFRSEDSKWEAKELTAPFHGVLAPQPLNTNVPESDEIKEEKKIEEKKTVVPPRYAPYIGKEITIELKNGDRLSGKLRQAGGGKILLSSASGTLTIRDADVVKIERK